MKVPLRGRLPPSLAAALEILLPRACPLCGKPILSGGGEVDEGGGDGSGLCRSCRAGLEAIHGERCRTCGKELISELGICMRCRGKAWSFDEALPIFSYGGEAAALIGAYKFAGRRSLSGYFAGLFASILEERWKAWPIVPVPFRRKKIVEKGWDQVDEIAARLESRGFDVRRILERRPSDEQKRLSSELRFTNARSAYCLKPGCTVPPRLVLVDDVLTTGATAEACARALKGGGAAHVAFLVIAAD